MKYGVLIIGMILVTYIPRMIPITALRNTKLPPWIRRLLDLLPGAALGALIIPGVLTSIPERPAIGVIAVIIAGCASLLHGGLILGVVVGVAAAFILTVLI